MIDFDNLQFGTAANVFVFVIFIIAVAAYIVYLQVFLYKKPKDERASLLIGDDLRFKEMSKKLVDDMFDREFESVTIRTYDKKILFGRLYRGAEGAPMDICFHGYNGTSRRDFSGGARFLIDEGHNVLLIDERAHSKSEGHSITFGIKERYDCLTWINYILDKFGKDKKITLYGISMGAATVLMASELNLPENVTAIIADCPYSSPKEIIKKSSADMGYPPKLVYPLIFLASRIFAHFDLNAATAADAVKNAKAPILIIHGEDDRFVPCEMSREIAQANEKLIRRETFPEAGHGLSFVVDRNRYVSTVRSFLADVSKVKK